MLLLVEILALQFLSKIFTYIEVRFFTLIFFTLGIFCQPVITQSLEEQEQKVLSKKIWPVYKLALSNAQFLSLEAGLLFSNSSFFHPYSFGAQGVLISVEPGMTGVRSGFGYAFYSNGEFGISCGGLQLSHLYVWSAASPFEKEKHYLGAQGRLGFGFIALSLGGYYEPESQEPYFNISLGLVSF